MTTLKPIEPLCPQNYFGRGVNYQLPQTEAAIQWFDEQWTAWEAAHPDDVSGEIAYAAFVEQQRLWKLENKGEAFLKELGEYHPPHSVKGEIEPESPTPTHPVERKVEPVEITINCDVGDYELSHSDYVEQEKTEAEIQQQDFEASIHKHPSNHAVSVSAPPAGHAIFPFAGRAEKHQVRLTIDKRVYNEFYRHCQRRGTTMSFVVEALIKIQLLNNK